MIFSTDDWITEDGKGDYVANKDHNSVMYGVRCDECGDEFGDDEFSPRYSPDAKEIETIAEDWGWGRIGDQHFCPHCCEYDEEKECFVRVKRVKEESK